MDIAIRKLTPDLAEDYVRFFDTTPHYYDVEAHKCYCVCWSSDDCEGKDFSTAEKRREYARRYIRDGKLQGYLAYSGGKIVGWCNANTKSDCLKCLSWSMFMGSVPTGETTRGTKVKSIFCFVIVPGMQRKGIASRLVERVCQDAAIEGFDFAEAYPNKEFVSTAEDFMGPAELYRKSGFDVYYETEHRLVMRKPLK